MSKFNYKQHYAIQNKIKKQVSNYYDITDCSGIYIFTREEHGIKHCYVGQAKNVLSRVVEHIQRYDSHLDRSLKIRGLKGVSTAKDKSVGQWRVKAFYCLQSELDGKEKETVLEYAGNGYQLYNKELGGQGGTSRITGSVRKGYNDGLRKGRENAIKEISALFNIQLQAVVQKDTKTAQKALEKFYSLIGGSDEK